MEPTDDIKQRVADLCNAKLQKLNSSQAMMEAVNLSQGLFVDGNGDTFPIVAMFDDAGEECAPADAVAAVAGTEGRWYCLDLSEFGAGVSQ